MTYHVYTPHKNPPNECLASFLSNPWPYAISPLQAYLVGVFGCMSTFLLYIFISHNLYKMNRKRRHARKKYKPPFSSRRAKSHRPITSREDRLGTGVDDQCSLAPRRTEVSGRRTAMESAATDMNSSYELHRQMNTFPLERNVNENNENQVEPAASAHEKNHSATMLDTIDQVMTVETKEDLSEEATNLKDSIGIKKSNVHKTIQDVLGTKRTSISSRNNVIVMESEGDLWSVPAVESYREVQQKPHDLGASIQPTQFESSREDTSATSASAAYSNIPSQSIFNDDITFHHNPSSTVSIEQTNSMVEQEEQSTNSYLIVLISTGVADEKQAANQVAAMKLLDDQHLNYYVVDGIDLSQLEQRNELFGISGIHGSYPQIFICDQNSRRYVGGYDVLEEVITEWTYIHSSNKCTLESTDPAISDGNKSMTVLISTGVVDYQQKSNQKSALQLLIDLKIPHKVVDGMDPTLTDKRNELFKISGIRGKYPQLFLSDENDGQLRYLGGHEWMEDQSITELTSILD